MLTPLGSEGPGFGASLLSFAKKPAIGLDLRVAGGEVTKVPWLKKELEGGVLQGLEDTMLWPKRVVAPADDERGRPLLSAEKLAELVNDDPLLRLERELEEKRSVLGVTDDENDDAKAFLIELNPPEVRREETKPPRWQRQLEGIKKGIAAKTRKKVAAKHDAAMARHAAIQRDRRPDDRRGDGRGHQEAARGQEREEGPGRGPQGGPGRVRPQRRRQGRRRGLAAAADSEEGPGRGPQGAGGRSAGGGGLLLASALQERRGLGRPPAKAKPKAALYITGLRRSL